MQRVEFVVERFDEGITIRCSNSDEKFETSKRLAVHGREASSLGEELWDDIERIFASEKAEIVRVNIEYNVAQ